MDETDSELLVLWVLTGAAVLLMLVRLIMQGKRLRKFEWGDYLTMAAIAAILLRSSVESVAMELGDNQISAKDRATFHFTPEYIHQHEVGSKLTMVNRVFYTV